jgi:hypothetical protein
VLEISVSNPKSHLGVLWSLPKYFLKTLHSPWNSQSFLKDWRKGLSNDNNYILISTVLHPVKILRNISHFQLRDANALGVPGCVGQDENAVQFTSLLEDATVLEVELNLIAAGDDALELCSKMYSKLLEYAKSFERNTFSKKEMELDQDMIIDEDELGTLRSQYLFYQN